MEKNKKKTIQFCFIFFILSILKTKGFSNFKCEMDKCARCIKRDLEGICDICIDYVTDIQKGQCTEKISDWIERTDNEKFKNCEILKIDEWMMPKCYKCKDNYVLTSIGSCQRTTISRCVMGKYDRNAANSPFFKEKCYVCKNSFPSKDRNFCQEVPRDFEDRKCKYFGRVDEYEINKAAACILCKNTEIFYADSETGNCESINGDIKGCGLGSDGVCSICDYRNGFFMIQPGICNQGWKLITFWSIFVLGFLLIN